ncbi:MAG TPA: hypothetical protein VM409_07450 [Chloroflexia bacterium]|nr:hypothetical protein [Chloroflexia bacterium]
MKTRTAPLGSWNEDLWARILKLGQELDDKRPAADEGTEYDQWIRAVEAANIEPVEAIPRDKGINDLEIWLRVQTAHDPEGYLDLRYKGVVYYSFNAAFGDWLLDEVRLSQAGRLVHEIELISATYWTIECEDIEVEWQPL